MKRYSYILSILVCVGAFLGIHLLNLHFRTYITSPASAMGVQQFVKSRPKIILDSLRNDSTYCYQYVFRDHKNNLLIWRWDYDRYEVDSASEAFGLPKNYFQPYRPTSSVLKKREQIREKALFKKVDRIILPDYNAIVEHHRQFTKPLHDLIELALGDSATKEDKLEIILKFCQDLPYQIPPPEYQGKIIEGIFPPALSLKVGYGDCDTKAMLFASTLSHDPHYEMLLLTVPNHVLMAVKGIPKPYQHFIEHQGEKYILCQPVGPARLAFGNRGSNFRPVENITEIKQFAKPTTRMAAASNSVEKTTPESSENSD